MDCFCDYDAPRVYVKSEPTARKEHKCSECGCTIKPGERYERVFGVWSGYSDMFKTCQRCVDLREWVQAHVPCMCWAHGNTRDDAIETARHYAREAPGLLFGAYRLEVAIVNHRRQQRSQHGST